MDFSNDIYDLDKEKLAIMEKCKGLFDIGEENDNKLKNYRRQSRNLICHKKFDIQIELYFAFLEYFVI